MSETNVIHVLDKGFVRLVDHMGNDLSIVRAARVSYDADWRVGEDAGKDERLINYLYKNKHTSPFESVVFTFEVKAPMFVLRQWHRHRSWCVAGNVPLIFNRPSDGAAYRKSMASVVRSFNDSTQRARLMQMGLRGPDGLTRIVDAWHSGEKPVYRLFTKYGAVTASADHIFKTPDGSMKLGESPSHVMGLVRVGGDDLAEWPSFSSSQLARQRWVEFANGYEVSDLGLVRTYWGQGSRSKRSTPIDKRQSINNAGRAVVNIGGHAKQVSRLVAQAFLGEVGEMQVLHRNDNPLDNRLTNLYLGTAADNARDQYANGGRVRLREVPLNVERIEAVGIQDTFDITVTGNHWFAADNLIIHNSYNEISARYCELDEGYYVPNVAQITTQSASNKQMRTKEQHPQAKEIRAAIAKVNEDSYRNYKTLIETGCPRELARSVLPVGAYSRMFATVDLHNLLHFLRLRSHEHAQWEIQEYARAMESLIQPIVPYTVAAYRKSLESAA